VQTHSRDVTAAPEHLIELAYDIAERMDRCVSLLRRGETGFTRDP
jgi:hypothetical protein